MSDARTISANGQRYDTKEKRGCSNCGGGCLAPLFGLIGQDEGDKSEANPPPGDEDAYQFSEKKSLASKGGRRPSVHVMDLHRKTVEATNSSQSHSSKGSPVNRSNIHKGMYVVRGPDWKYGDEDGGSVGIGVVWHLDMNSETATVMWGNGHAYGHYRFGSASDLVEHVEVDGGAFRITSSTKSWGATSSLNSFLFSSARRNSQAMFSQRNQTAIVLDWDDTLFPSTYLRFTLRLSPRLPLHEQKIPPQQKLRAEAVLRECAANVVALLKTVSEVGNMVIVTLARKPWVTDSCAYFYPGVGELLKELQVKIVYAQETLTVNPAITTRGMTDEETGDFWAGVKGRAIGGELEGFYTLYEGQSWKNVLSIGDSEFERVGTKGATERYSEMRGLGDARGATMVDGHVYNVRTKTFKMLDGPSAEELTVQVQMLQRWVPYLVMLDDSFDADLNDVNDIEAIGRIESQLKIPTSES